MRPTTDSSPSCRSGLRKGHAEAVTRSLLIASMVAAYLGVLQEDLVAARAIQLEMDALGREARKRRRQVLGRLAVFIYDSHQQALGVESG